MINDSDDDTVDPADDDDDQIDLLNDDYQDDAIDHIEDDNDDTIDPIDNNNDAIMDQIPVDIGNDDDLFDDVLSKVKLIHLQRLLLFYSI